MNLLLILIVVSMAETLGKAAEDGVESSSSGTAAETKAAKSTNALAYIPHAGLGNQLIAFVNANVLAMKLNLSLVAPALLPHFAVDQGNCCFNRKWKANRALSSDYSRAVDRLARAQELVLLSDVFIFKRNFGDKAVGLSATADLAHSTTISITDECLVSRTLSMRQGCTEHQSSAAHKVLVEWIDDILERTRCCASCWGQPFSWARECNTMGMSAIENLLLSTIGKTSSKFTIFEAGSLFRAEGMIPSFAEPGQTHRHLLSCLDWSHWIVRLLDKIVHRESCVIHFRGGDGFFESLFTKSFQQQMQQLIDAECTSVSVMTDLPFDHLAESLRSAWQKLTDDDLPDVGAIASKYEPAIAQLCDSLAAIAEQRSSSLNDASLSNDIYSPKNASFTGRKPRCSRSKFLQQLATLVVEMHVASQSANFVAAPASTLSKVITAMRGRNRVAS